MSVCLVALTGDIYLTGSVCVCIGYSLDSIRMKKTYHHIKECILFHRTHTDFRIIECEKSGALRWRCGMQ